MKKMLVVILQGTVLPHICIRIEWIWDPFKD